MRLLVNFENKYLSQPETQSQSRAGHLEQIEIDDYLGKNKRELNNGDLVYLEHSRQTLTSKKTLPVLRPMERHSHASRDSVDEYTLLD